MTSEDHTILHDTVIKIMKKSQEFEKSMRRASLVYAISTGTMNTLGLSSRGSDYCGSSSGDLTGGGQGQGQGQVIEGGMIVTSMSSKSRGSTKSRAYQIMNAKTAPPTYYTTAELIECIEQCRSLSRDLRKASKKAIVKKLSTQALTSLGKEGEGGSRHPSLSGSHPGAGASSKKALTRDDGVSVSMKVIRVHRAFINNRVRAAIKAIPTMSRRVAPEISSRFTSSKQQTSATLSPSVRQHSTHSAHLSFSSKLKPILPPSIDPTLARASQQTSANPSSHSSNSTKNSDNKNNNNNNHTKKNSIFIKVCNLFTSVFRRSNKQRS